MLRNMGYACMRLHLLSLLQASECDPPAKDQSDVQERASTTLAHMIRMPTKPAGSIGAALNVTCSSTTPCDAVKKGTTSR